MNNCFKETSVPFSLASLEAEIQQEADARIVEVILRLANKLEQISTSDSGELLKIYVLLKRAKHHFKRRIYYDWNTSQLTWEEFNLELDKFNLKISEARRKYYAAKQQRGN